MTGVTSKLVFRKNFRRHLFKSSVNLSSKKPVKLAYINYNEKLVGVSKKPPLLILHGLMGCKSNWNTLASNLSKKLNPIRPIYILDARNHGQSPHDPDVSFEAMTEDLKLFIDTKTPGRQVALMGHSMGGLTNILFALKWPETVEKLIAVDVNPIVPQKETDIIKHIVKVLKLMQSFPIKKKETTLTKERQKLFTFLKREVPSKRTRQFLMKNLIRSNGHIKWQLNIPVLVENKEEFTKFPNLIGKKTYAGPSFFIGGGDSHFLRKTDFPEIKKLLPNAEFTFIEDTGHWLHYEKPEDFIKIVSKYLNK